MIPDEYKPNVEYAAGALVLVSATIHLLVGGIELADALNGAGQLGLAALYILSAVVAYALVGAYVTGRIRPIHAYVAGAALMFLYLLAYADYHAFNYVESVLPLDAGGAEHSHGGHDHGGHDHSHDHSHGHGDEGQDPSAFGVLVDHLVDDPFALVSKVAELISGVLLSVLAVNERK